MKWKKSTRRKHQTVAVPIIAAKARGGNMKKNVSSLFVTLLVLVLSSSACAGWKDKIVKNQFKAVGYIEKLKAGADPDEISRPHMRYDEMSEANAANDEIRKFISEAENYARQGRHERIAIPIFSHRLVSEEYRQKLKREYYRERRQE